MVTWASLGRNTFLSIFICLLLFLFTFSACKSHNDDLPRSRRPHNAIPRPKVWSEPLKVVVIVLENTDYDIAVAQPYLSELIRKGALLKNYNAIVRQSQPNYIAMTSGSTYG